MLSLALRIMRLHRFQRTPWDPRPFFLPALPNTKVEGGGTQILICLDLLVALTHFNGWSSAMDARPHEGPGWFSFRWPDLGFLGPILLHFYDDMSLTTGPVDGSLPLFQDRLESDWGGIQTQGANCFQQLLETLDDASLRTLLGGLADRNWHQFGTQWSEI